MAQFNRRQFIQASTASLLLEKAGGALFPAAAAQNAAPTAFVHTNAEGASWTLGNALVEREIHFDAQTGLSTAHWLHKVTGTDFVEPARRRSRQGSEFSFSVDGESLAGSNGAAWEFVEASTSELTPAGQQLSIHLRGKSKPLDLVVHYAVYDGHPVVQKWLAVTNRGTATVTLTRFAFEIATIRPGPPDVLQAAGFYAFEPKELFFTGRVDDAAVLERNAQTGEGFIAMNAAPGYTKRTELVGWGDGVQAMYDTDLFPFERTLQPDETFTSAKSSIAFFVDGKGFADPQWLVPSFTSQILMKKGANYQPPWIYNTWEPFQRGITRQITMDSIAAAGRMGMDIFTVDDGWQRDYGDNTINLKLFPNGLDEIQAAVEKQGMRLGLWSPLAAISPNIEVYRQHPEWICVGRDGKPKFTGTAAGAQAVMCLASPYREVAARRISDLIGRYHLAYVKIDLTTVFNAYGESPGCYAHGHDHATWAESLIRIYEGMQYVTDRIYRDHPEVLLDLTFELWGQKHIIDYGLLAAGDLDWLSNVDDGRPGAAGPRQARTLLYLRSLAIPVDTMLIGNLQAQLAPIEDRLGTAMGSGPLFLGDLRQLTAQQQDWYGEKIRWFKKLRREVHFQSGITLLRGGQMPSAATWDGFARLSREGEGLIVLFKNESTVDRVPVKVPIFPDGHFRVRSLWNNYGPQTVSGEKLRQGIEVPFPTDSKVQILEVRK